MLYLSGWANDRGQVQLHVLGGKPDPVPVNISNVAVHSNFYDIQLPDGSASDMVESAMADVESEISVALREVRAGVWPLSKENRDLLANFIALQMARTPSVRNTMMRGFDDLIEKADLMRTSMHEMQEQDPARYDRMVEAQRKLSGPDDGSGIPASALPELRERLALSAFETSADLVEPVGMLNWTLLESDSIAFVTCDQPLVNWPLPNHPPFYGVGLFTAERTTLPLSPTLCLELRTPIRLDDSGITGPQPDAHRQVSRAEVVEINERTARHAHVHIVLPGLP